MFSLSDWKFPLCQFQIFTGVSYGKLTLKNQHPVSLESGNLELEQTNYASFSCVDKISKFPVFSLMGIFGGPFSLFSLCSGDPVLSNVCVNLSQRQRD